MKQCQSCGYCFERPWRRRDGEFIGKECTVTQMQDIVEQAMKNRALVAYEKAGRRSSNWEDGKNKPKHHSRRQGADVNPKRKKKPLAVRGVPQGFGRHAVIS